MENLIALHRYWIYADFLRLRFQKAMKDSSLNALIDQYKEIGVLWFLLTAPGIYMAYWYGSLYIVIEGYQCLEFKDSKIDELLKSPNVDYLRRFRNGTFHYQREPFSKKLIEFWESCDSVEWVKQIHLKLGEFIFESLVSQFSNGERQKFVEMLKEVTDHLSTTGNARND